MQARKPGSSKLQPPEGTEQTVNTNSSTANTTTKNGQYQPATEASLGHETTDRRTTEMKHHRIEWDNSRNDVTSKRPLRITTCARSQTVHSSQGERQRSQSSSRAQATNFNDATCRDADCQCSQGAAAAHCVQPACHALGRGVQLRLTHWTTCWRRSFGLRCRKAGDAPNGSATAGPWGIWACTQMRVRMQTPVSDGLTQASAG